LLVYEVENLVKKYPRQQHPANEHLSFEVREGEIFGILGNNGAGKSTLVRQLANLLRSTSGIIRLHGRPLDEEPLRVPLTVGYMPQEAGALNRLTTGEALYFSAHLRGMGAADARRERDQLLEFWGLSPLRDRDSATLSGGERRLLRLAVAQAGALPVLLLDEPTNDLDPLRRRLVWSNLRKLKKERGTTIIFITHDALEAEKVIERVAIMHKGRMVAVGAPATLKERLGHRFRFELRFSPDRQPQLPPGSRYEQRDEGHWVVYAKGPEAVELLALLQRQDLDDLRMQSPTLEDLYFHYVTE